jgi:valyl-tRNA synthetase
MSEEYPKTYSPTESEKKCLALWEQGQYFKADPHSKKPPYSIVMPPPNVTGVLHMGHALVSTLQDILIRFKRMSGFETLWVPGTDHAGIATQTVVERALLKEKNKRRTDFSREEFIQLVWEWKEKSEKIILHQIKQMGCSCDFSRLRFTMDEGCNVAVRALFKKLYDQELIYRGHYLVNWDPVAQTALSDDEVEYEERKGHLWTFKYPLADQSGYIHIATTRPETMLGDTAVAVSPKDPRYTQLVGKQVRLPIVDRIIPIISDHHIDPEFGTGAVKITPAHDPNDYRIGIDHGLEMINIFTPDGHINENGNGFKGMTREKAREAIVLHMKELGLLEKTEIISHRVGLSYRSKAVIEPYLSQQWFIKMAPFKEKLKKAVEEKRVRLLPSSWEHTYFHWINNLRDWCISRQLWWGHRIPIWYHKENGRILCYGEQGEPEEVRREPHLWVQDNDVLDTWFSSALWPFSTLGWPHYTLDLKHFYPTSVLITGHDILFFWVARMMMMGEFVLDELPFPETFLHGLIFGRSYWKISKEGDLSYITGEERKEYDLGKPVPKGVESKWEKISKSKGNAIDPLEIMSEYGTDALRIALCARANHSPQIDLDRRQIEEYKNFANKIWNGARFVLMNLEDFKKESLAQGLDKKLFALEDHWLLSRLNRLAKESTESLNNYQFETAATVSYEFYWKEFCAYYVEIAKPVLFGKIGDAATKNNKQKLLIIALTFALRLLHPIAPFITEELFGIIKKKVGGVDPEKSIDPYTQECLEALAAPVCATSHYPKVIEETAIDATIEQRFALVEEIVYAVRNMRAEVKMALHEVCDLYLIGANEIKAEIGILLSLLKIGKIHFVTHPPHLPHTASKNVGSIQVVIPLSEELMHQEHERLHKELEKLHKLHEQLEKQLQNEGFVSRAKPELVEKQREVFAETQNEICRIKKKLEFL